MNQSIEELLSKEVLYTLPVWTHEKETLKKLLKAHPAIQFASLVAVDLGGNDTDEKIPISLFIDEMDEFLTNGVQTDGSSVVLHGIATLNNAKVDLVPDLLVNWFVDYNYDHIHEETALPIGTLRIPAFIVHDGKRVDSRSVLKRTEDYYNTKVKSILQEYPSLIQELNINSADEIEEVKLTAATELEFWVKTPEDPADEEKLSTSQMLKEQYWKRTKGNVRTALEESIMILEKYGFEPEMGHKEVGGVTAKIGVSGKLNHVMEQLEIDWKYSTALQCADNELFIRELVEEAFERYGLEVTFMAKPIEGVAGSGKHVHISLTLKLKNGKYVNLFAPKDMKKNYLNVPGWGALFGLLRNYEVVNPFVTATNDAFNRLKPGFEAPICIVGSIGHTVEVPSRNRTVLVGLIRDINNPLATRFELRSPNPASNTYLTIGAIYQTMMDGMLKSIKAGMTSEQLEKEFSKDAGEEKFYLEKDRAYRSEEDVFVDYTETERRQLFGTPPATVWENLKGFSNYPERRALLLEGDVFTDPIVDAYRLATLTQWVTELMGRIIPNNMDLVRSCKKLHQVESATDLDVVNWEKVNSLRIYLMKDSMEKKSLFTRVREAVEGQEYDTVSELQQEMADQVVQLKQLYLAYRRNLLEEINGTPF